MLIEARSKVLILDLYLAFCITDTLSLSLSLSSSLVVIREGRVHWVYWTKVSPHFITCAHVDGVDVTSLCYFIHVHVAHTCSQWYDASAHYLLLYNACDISPCDM